MAFKNQNNSLICVKVALVEFVAPSKFESCWPTTGVSILVTNVQTNQTAKLVSKQQKLKNYLSYHKPKTEHSQKEKLPPQQETKAEKQPYLRVKPTKQILNVA